MASEYDAAAVQLVYDLLQAVEDTEGWVEVWNAETETASVDLHKRAMLYLEAHGCTLSHPIGPMTADDWQREEFSQTLLERFYQPPTVLVDADGKVID